ncbi:MAG: PKD domain-containing protein, partial [Candidatus Kapabacteria bacterium]|nr:PKD domain-containing protein [Candidatus Kapabacteria bacterium]
MKKIFYLLSLTTIFCCAFFQNLHSETTPRSTRGKEFWVGWPDNSNDQNPSYCGVFIFAKRLTKVSAIYEGNEMKYILSDTNKFFVTFGLWDSQEVQDSEVKLKKGVRIVADDSVDVYISSMATVHGLESTVAYPITALAKDYYVLTRKEGSAQTQFQIVAAYDSTEIEITPSATTELGKPAFVPFVITLNKFETYLVRSSGDLTGTKVRSVKKEICQPFALFAGSPRTTIGGCSPNGFLWEQIPPASLVGTNYIVPHYPFSSGSILRAMAIYPGTLLRLDGMGVGNVLSSGQFFDMNVETFANVTANKPIMLAQFTRGGGCTPTSPSVPTMTILSAISQFQYETYITPALGNLIFPTDTLTLSIITRYSERGVTRINNQPVNINDWKIIPSNPIYAAYQKPVFLRDTIKIFHDMSGFNATIFGGNANQSFAMSSGGSFANTVSVRFDTSGIYGKNAYCKGEVANFSVSADSSGTSFRWEFGDGSSDTGKTVSHIYENSGNYILRLIVYRETFCAYDTTRKIINVRPSPAIKAGARPTLTLCKGQTAQLGLPELPGISYRWSPAIGLSDTTVGQPTVTATLDSVKYFVRGYDSFGCETQDSIVVKLYDQPIANAGPDTVSCGGN